MLCVIWWFFRLLSLINQSCAFTFSLIVSSVVFSVSIHENLGRYKNGLRSSLSRKGDGRGIDDLKQLCSVALSFRPLLRNVSPRS